MVSLKKKKPVPAFIGRLKKSLVDALKANGIVADIDVESVPTTRLYRVAIRAAKFKQLKYSERQNLVWRIAERAISPDEQMRISMILTLTPDEATEK